MQTLYENLKLGNALEESCNGLGNSGKIGQHIRSSGMDRKNGFLHQFIYGLSLICLSSRQLHKAPIANTLGRGHGLLQDGGFSRRTRIAINTTTGTTVVPTTKVCERNFTLHWNNTTNCKMTMTKNPPFISHNQNSSLNPSHTYCMLCNAGHLPNFHWQEPLCEHCHSTLAGYQSSSDLLLVVKNMWRIHSPEPCQAGQKYWNHTPWTKQRVKKL